MHNPVPDQIRPGKQPITASRQANAGPSVKGTLHVLASCSPLAATARAASPLSIIGKRDIVHLNRLDVFLHRHCLQWRRMWVKIKEKINIFYKWRLEMRKICSYLKRVPSFLQTFQFSAKGFFFVDNKKSSTAICYFNKRSRLAFSQCV